MSGGWRELVVNTQERAVSTDVNRSQKFKGRDLGEFFRQMLLTQYAGLRDPGFVTIPNGSGAPLPCEIIGGLMVRPQVNTLNLLIDAGVAMFIAPDGGADDSDCKYLRDGGVTNAGALTITANASGSARIDFIECRPNPVLQVVTDNRDIFNASSGLFSAATITKESQSVIEYRVRAGVPGSGSPGLVSGWRPLAVASVPDGTTNVNTITFWDVRPMLSDREAVGDNAFDLPQLLQLDARLSRPGANTATMNGYWKAVHRGRKIGGQFRRGTPGVDNDSIELGSAANQSSALTEPLPNHVYLYACFPHGLPRWTMYAPHPAARLPRTPNGMLIVSTIKPDENGLPTDVIPLPTSTALGVSVSQSEALCVAILGRLAGGDWAQFHATNRIIMFGGVGQTLTSAAEAGGVYDFTITSDFWPANAKALYARVSAVMTVPTVSSQTLLSRLSMYETLAATGSFARASEFYLTATNASGGSFPGHAFGSPIIRIPLPYRYPSSPSDPRLLRWALTASSGYGSAVTYAATASLNVYGFEM